jgi:hypothetical protein
MVSPIGTLSEKVEHALFRRFVSSETTTSTPGDAVGGKPETSVTLISCSLKLNQAKSTSRIREQPAAAKAAASRREMFLAIRVEGLTKTLSDAPPRASDCNRDATGAFVEARVKRQKHPTSHCPGLGGMVGAVPVFVRVMEAVRIMFSPWARRIGVLALGKWVSPYAR